MLFYGMLMTIGDERERSGSGSGSGPGTGSCVESHEMFTFTVR